MAELSDGLIDGVIDGAAAILGLHVLPEHRPGIAANLALLSRHAAIALAVPLPPEAEPAPVFRPGDAP
jgi:Protein of unknown function (DUF4089)